MTTPIFIILLCTWHAQVATSVDTVNLCYIGDEKRIYCFVEGFTATDITKVCAGRVGFVFMDFF